MYSMVIEYSTKQNIGLLHMEASKANHLLLAKDCLEKSLAISTSTPKCLIPPNTTKIGHLKNKKPARMKKKWAQ